MAKTEEDIFFIHIREPVEIRKNILESSKQTVQLLQRYEMIRDLRVQKVEQVNRLKRNFKELVVLVNKLKTEMPKVNVRVKIKQEEMQSTQKSQTLRKARPVAGNRTELQKLEEELRSIESKLTRLS